MPSDTPLLEAMVLEEAKKELARREAEAGIPELRRHIHILSRKPRGAWVFVTSLYGPNGPAVKRQARD